MRPTWIASCLRVKESRFNFRKCLRSRLFLRPPLLILARSRKRLRDSFQNRRITLLDRPREERGVDRAYLHAAIIIPAAWTLGCLGVRNTLAVCRTMGFRARRGPLSQSDGLGGPSYGSVHHLGKVLREFEHRSQRQKVTDTFCLLFSPENPPLPLGGALPELLMLTILPTKRRRLSPFQNSRREFPPHQTPHSCFTKTDRETPRRLPTRRGLPRSPVPRPSEKETRRTIPVTSSG